MTWTVATISALIPYLLGAKFWLISVLWVPGTAILPFLWAYAEKNWLPPKLVRSVVDTPTTLGLGPGPD